MPGRKPCTLREFVESGDALLGILKMADANPSDV